MRILLVDRSRSMAEPVSGDGPSRWAAAKEAALADIRGLPPGTEVYLLAFASEAVLIEGGRALEAGHFAAALDRVGLADGTDVAAALEAALDLAADRHWSPLPPSILLLTDGLADPEPAVRLAQLCVDTRVPVDVRVIGSTDAGRALAARIAGLSRAVPAHREVSDEDFDEDFAGRPPAGAKGTASPGMALGAVAGRWEPLEFTATFPGLLPAADTGALTVYAHQPSMAAELARVLGERRSELGSRPSGSSGSAGQVPRGVELVFRPVFRDLRCTPVQQSVIWEEHLEEVRFRIAYAGWHAERVTCTGQVDISADGLLIAQLPVSLEVISGAGPAEAPAARAGAGMIRDVFASYAHEDEAMVRRCKAAYRALGIHLFVDTDDLLGGQTWREALAERIRRADLVQLYWSAHAATSEHVTAEWKLALEAGRPGFLRPFYWTRPLGAVPDDLRDLHFAYVDPQSVGLVTAPAHPASTAAAPPPADRPVFTAFACVPDTDGTVAHVVRALPAVVAFVERLTGVRHHPPPPVLVDQPAVAAARPPLRSTGIGAALAHVAFTAGADAVVDTLAAAHGVPAFARPPAGPKVLIAAGALTRIAAAGFRSGSVLHCVLVHEYLRAVLRHEGELAASLAAWAQVHFVRGDPELSAACLRFIADGGPSAWPVRGPQLLEGRYRAGGLSMIRSWITGLRTDPQDAELRFAEERQDPWTAQYL